MSFSDDSKDEEEIKNILQHIQIKCQQMIIRLEGVSLFEQHNYEIHDYKQSKIWLEFKNLNKQREEMLDKIENDMQYLTFVNLKLVLVYSLIYVIISLDEQHHNLQCLDQFTSSTSQKIMKN